MGRKPELLRDFAGLKAARADLDATRPAVDLGVHRLQVDIEAPLGQVVGVADIIAGAWFLAAYFTNLCHLLLR
jgi:hypothetical protein